MTQSSSESEPGLAASLFKLAADELAGRQDPEFAGRFLAPTPAAFDQFVKLLGCTLMYRSDIYDEFYQSLVDDYPRNLYLLPRASYKSTALCCSVVRDIILNRDDCILYSSETLEQAKEYTGWVFRQLEENKRLIEAVGEFKPKRGAKKWAEGEFTVLGRTDLSKKEATVTAKGLEQVRAGPHYRRIIVDDPCSPENTKTAGSLRATVDAFKHIFAIATTTVDEEGEIVGRTRLDVSCTRYNEADMLGYVKAMNAELLKKRQAGDESAIPWRVIEYPAYDENGNTPFRHLPRAVLEQMRSEMGPRVFSAQMLLNPVPEDQARFKRPQFKYIPETQVPRREMLYTYLLTDLATTFNEDSDGQCLIVVGRDATGRDYVLDLVWKRMSPNDAIDALFEMYVAWGCRHALLEKSIFSDLYQGMIEHVSIERQIRIRIITVMGRTTESKEHRIDSLDIPMSGGTLFWSSHIRPEYIRLNPADQQCYGEVCDQFLNFPRGRNDDIPDALSDLYKTDRKGSPLCPRPRAAVMANRQAQAPRTVNGRIVPGAQRPGGDLWGNLRKQVQSGTGGIYGPGRG